MPAWRLDDQNCSIRRYDVAGQDSDSQPEFVRHVGLCEEDSDTMWLGSELVLSHMGPPLETGSEGNPIQSVGTVPITYDQQQQIRVFLDELSSEYEAQRARPKRQYIICPHAAPPNETIPFRRFNCAGFVIEAYRDAGIDLITTDDDSLPGVTLEVLVHAYPEHSQQLADDKLREFFGLPGDGPWPVVLAGYVMNSLGRSTEAINAGPHVPAEGDEFFPAQHPGAGGNGGNQE